MRSGSDRHGFARGLFGAGGLHSARALFCGFLPIVAMATIARSAAAGGADEPSYGRIDGDLSLVAGVGGVIAARAPRVGAELRVRYLESAGLFATYEDGASIGAASDPARVLAGGLELRPVFLYRWLEGLEARRARFDLTIDSIGLEIAATLAQPEGGAALDTVGLQVGLGVEVPIETSPTGLWIGLHGGLRWSADALAYGSVQNATDRAFFLAITIAWHQQVAAHVVDAGDRAPQ
jgi:hypothetical protein